jgi:hypothetical protein
VLRQLASQGYTIAAFGNEHCMLRERGMRLEDFLDYGAADFSLPSARNLVAGVNPRLLLLGTNSRKDGQDILERSLVYAAREQGIPSLAVQGYWGVIPSHYDDCSGQMACFPDHLAVIDGSTREGLAGLGADTRRIYVTGNPDLEEMIKARDALQQGHIMGLREKAGASPGKSVILYASRPVITDVGEGVLGYTERTAPSDFLSCLQSLSVEMRDRIHIVFRLHPREDRKWLVDEVAKHHASIPSYAIGNGESTLEAIASADYVVSFSTNVLLASAALGARPICYQPGLRSDDPILPGRSGMAFRVYEEGMIGDALSRMVSERAYFVRGCSASLPKDFYLDATARVVAVVKRLLA